MNTKRSHTFFKLLAAMLFLFLLLIGIPAMMEAVYDRTIGIHHAYIITSGLSLPYLIAGLSVFVIFVWLYGRYGICVNPFSRETGIKAQFSPKIKRRIACITAALFFLFLLVYLSWFDCFTTDGLTCRRVFDVQRYTWDEIDHYSLSSAYDGVLKCTVTTKDGKSAVCLGSMIGFSSLPEDTYPDGEDDFVKELVKRFTDQGIPNESDSWEKLEKNLKYDYWKDYLKELKTITEG